MYIVLYEIIKIVNFFPSVATDGSIEKANFSKKRPLCKFGADCYRKNPWHLEEFYHPHLEDKDDTGAKRKSGIRNCNKGLVKGIFEGEKTM